MGDVGYEKVDMNNYVLEIESDVVIEIAQVNKPLGYMEYGVRSVPDLPKATLLFNGRGGAEVFLDDVMIAFLKERATNPQMLSVL